MHFRNAGDHMRVQPLGFGAVAEVQDARAVALYDIGFAAAAGQQGEAGDQNP